MITEQILKHMCKELEAKRNELQFVTVDMERDASGTLTPRYRSFKSFFEMEQHKLPGFKHPGPLFFQPLHEPVIQEETGSSNNLKP